MINIQVFENPAFQDDRGELWTIYNSKDLPDLKFNHDKISTSKHNVLRGLHTDKSYKLITCLYGKIQLVVVDFNKESPNYLLHESFILDASESTKKSVLVPPYFLNGHLVLSDHAVFHYKWSYPGDYPDVSDQVSVNWADPTLNINWLSDNPILSDRDRNSKFLHLKSFSQDG
jgi:dTDP-4-dehydrorhamnose 3,5-epimerase